MSQPTLHPPDFTTYNEQTSSPLFTTLPPELRSQIFTYALSPSEDKSKEYSKSTYWTRPGYEAPHRTYTGLLRTCKRIYAESWFMPFALAEHAFYLTAHDRAPRNLSVHELAGFLDTIRSIHSDELEIQNVRVFAQLYKLEPGDLFAKLLDTPHFRPRKVTLTIRYTDFWLWEHNQRLYIDGAWVREIRFPDSVRVFEMDFESLERRREEVEIVSQQAVERWVFRRADGRVMKADRGDLVRTKWSGSSMLGGRRWVRDESRPGELDYYVVTACWRVCSDMDEGEEEMNKEDLKVRVPDDYQQPPPPYPQFAGSIPERQMREAGATMDMSADVAVNIVNQVGQRQRTRRGLGVMGGRLH